MIKQLFKVKTLSAALLSAFMVIAVGSFSSLHAQTTTSHATSQGSSPADLDQLKADLITIIDDVQNNSNLNEVQVEARVVLYKNVYVYAKEGLSLEQSIEYSLNVSREAVKRHKNPETVDFKVIQQEAENNLL